MRTKGLQVEIKTRDIEAVKGLEYRSKFECCSLRNLYTQFALSIYPSLGDTALLPRYGHIHYYTSIYLAINMRKPIAMWCADLILLNQLAVQFLGWKLVYHGSAHWKLTTWASFSFSSSSRKWLNGCTEDYSYALTSRHAFTRSGLLVLANSAHMNVRHNGVVDILDHSYSPP